MKVMAGAVSTGMTLQFEPTMDYLQPQGGETHNAENKVRDP